MRRGALQRVRRRAYCQCEEKHGDSISLPFPMGKGVDVCAVNAAGADNKYMVSTYSMPEQIASPQGGLGVYTCEGGKSGGAYAQCDGGLCFRSTEETTFPGFDKPVPKGQIVCSCPITDASSGSAQGYQILGPYPCDKSFFKYCKSDVANGKTGSTIYVGAPSVRPRPRPRCSPASRPRLSTNADRSDPFFPHVERRCPEGPDEGHAHPSVERFAPALRRPSPRKWSEEAPPPQPSPRSARQRATYGLRLSAAALWGDVERGYAYRSRNTPGPERRMRWVVSAWKGTGS